MNHSNLLAMAGAALALVGCTSAPTPAPAPPPPPPRAAGDTCVAGPGQAFIGRRADAITGAELLRATNSREIRWVAPGAVVTMEYKFGRVTVGYDAAMTIRSVACS